MRKHFSEEELTPARLRMARIPAGARLIDNAISRAPGFMLENVIVMAGVPRIMQVMLDAVARVWPRGRPMLSRAVRLDVPEGDVAPGLFELQSAHPEVQIGSYPFFENKRLGTYVVLRSTDEARLAAAVKGCGKLLPNRGSRPWRGRGIAGMFTKTRITWRSARWRLRAGPGRPIGARFGRAMSASARIEKHRGMS